MVVTEPADAGRSTLLLDQEPEAELGGQAFWSFGGLFLVDSPEQRRMGVRNPFDLAMQDWLGTAGFDRGVDDPLGEDHWARQWATAYLDFAAELVAGMNRLTDEPLLDAADIERQIVARDREIANPFSKDAQVTAIHGARRHRGDALARTAAPHRILDPANGPSIGVKLTIVTRKTLGGLQTDLTGRVLDASAQPVPGLFAAGEVAVIAVGGATTVISTRSCAR